MQSLVNSSCFEKEMFLAHLMSCTPSQHSCALLHVSFRSVMIASFLKTHNYAGLSWLYWWFSNGQREHRDGLVCATVVQNCLMKEPCEDAFPLLLYVSHSEEIIDDCFVFTMFYCILVLFWFSNGGFLHMPEASCKQKQELCWNVSFHFINCAFCLIICAYELVICVLALQTAPMDL